MTRNGTLLPFVALVASALVGFDLVRTLRTGRARGKTGTITRAKRPERFWRYVTGDCVFLALCVFALLYWWLGPPAV